MKKIFMFVSLISVCATLASTSSWAISKAADLNKVTKVKFCAPTPDWIKDMPAFSDIYCCAETDVNARNDCLKNNSDGLSMTDSFVSNIAPQPKSSSYNITRSALVEQCRTARSMTDRTEEDEKDPDLLGRLYSGKIDCKLQLLKLYYDNTH